MEKRKENNNKIMAKATKDAKITTFLVAIIVFGIIFMIIIKERNFGIENLISIIATVGFLLIFYIFSKYAFKEFETRKASQNMVIKKLSRDKYIRIYPLFESEYGRLAYSLKDVVEFYAKRDRDGEFVTINIKLIYEEKMRLYDTILAKDFTKYYKLKN